MKLMKMILAATAALLFIAGQAYAGDHGSHDSMDHSGHAGKLIHSADVKGFKLAYHLIDMMANMKGSHSGHNMPADMKSHHLMLYITGQEGSVISDAKVGYLVTDGEGEKQKAMAMGMGGGYGADVDLKTGTYSIKTKIVHKGETLIDEFSYDAGK